MQTGQTCSFAGWNTASDASGTAYSNLENITGLTADLTLYAQWTCVPSGGGVVVPPVIPPVIPPVTTPPTTPPTEPDAPGCTVPNGNGRTQVNEVFTAPVKNTLVAQTHDCWPHVYATFQTDGNFVLYEAYPDGTVKPLWDAGTIGVAKGGWLHIQADGNLVIYNTAGKPVWASNTRFDQSGQSSGWLAVQSDGNMVMYYDLTAAGVPIWQTGTRIG